MKFTYPSGATPLDGYTIKRGIGIGGFGEVYFALNDAGKEVALKKIQRNLDIELRGVRQCLNLKHVNLISLWDIRTTGEGESWVVMEYVPGPSLRDVLEVNQNGLVDADIKSWFASTASGVSYLHENGIVHRDLKPGNIFCDLHEQVIKIGDYGLSKYISCSRRSGQTESVGTFHYMAPEIGKGVYGKEIDLYALGIILYELTTGLVPFDGESAQEIIMKHLTAEPDVSVLPSRFRKVISKSLRKDPKDRYRSVTEMAADLPWPDVASRSDSIVSQHSIGSIVNPASAQANRPSINPNRASSTELIDKLPTAIIDSLRRAGAKKTIFSVSNKLDSKTATTLESNVSGNGIDKSREDEPIAAVLHAGLARLTLWWKAANFSTSVKMVILIITGIVLIQNSQWLLPLMLSAGGLYFGYHLFRYSIAKKMGQSSLWLAHIRHVEDSLVLRQWLLGRPLLDRLTELIGSMLIAAFSCTVLNLFGFAVVTGVIDGGPWDSSIENWANYTWLTLVSVVGCWGILLANKRWDWRAGKSRWRHLEMMALGMALGLAAFFTAGWFYIDLTSLTLETSPPFANGLNWVLGVGPLAAYTLFFACFLGGVRWWQQCDPVRKARLSIAAILICMIWAASLSYLLPVPFTAVCIWAVVISFSVQLSAPWLDSGKRMEICNLQNVESNN